MGVCDCAMPLLISFRAILAQSKFEGTDDSTLAGMPPPPPPPPPARRCARLRKNPISPNPLLDALGHPIVDRDCDVA